MSNTSQPIIQTIELTKIYKDFWGRGRVRALDGLNIEVNSGEVFGLLGPNGSGKTTTVRLLLGLLFPTRGAVRIFGKSPRQIDTKKRIGYMPEESHLYDYLNAEETLDFFGRLFGLTREERRNRADSLIDMVGLEAARRRPIGEFSKGMARRIGLAQALINDPDVLVLDEPTTGLDPLGARQMKDLIQMMRDRGKTIFLCSHLLSDVEQICDRVCILYGGRAREVGNVSDLLSDRDRLEIRTPALDSQAIEEIKEVVRRHTGPEEELEVGAPSRRLEDHFLHVVEQARREKLETAGAGAGGPAAAFLTEEEEAEDIIEDLVQRSSRQEPDEEEQDETAEEPQPAAPEEQEDRELLDDLVKPGPSDQKEEITETEEEKEEVQPAQAPEGDGVQRDVIDQLTDSQDGSEEDQTAEDREED
ncbi:MAG: ABC transporter ATP-binding protein [Candidatus Brocadiia bacterium]